MAKSEIIHSKLLTIVFQVHNEEKAISDAILSAKLLSPNILVMDMESSDETAFLAKKAGAKVISISHYEFVEPIRHLAFTKTTSEWVLLLDADERLSQALVSEIKNTISKPTLYTHFRLKRKNIFAGKKWFKHGGWWPDSQIRLIQRKALVEWPERIHSTPKISGEMGILEEPFLHYFHGNLETMVKKTINFESQEASLLYKAKRPTNTLIFFRKYLGELYRRLIKQQGYLDGIYGLIESIYQAYSKTITWLLVHERKHQSYE